MKRLREISVLLIVLLLAVATLMLPPSQLQADEIFFCVPGDWNGGELSCDIGPDTNCEACTVRCKGF